MKIRPVEIVLIHADGRTDRQTHTTKLTVAFSIFLNAAETPVYSSEWDWNSRFRFSRVRSQFAGHCDQHYITFHYYLITVTFLCWLTR